MGGELPLRGLRVVELAGLGPAPLAATLLADLGADVVRVERSNGKPDEIVRGRRRLVVDLKTSEGHAAVLSMLSCADAVIEGFRPGVMERFGLGPQDLRPLNPALIYVRVTGWGQDGPLSQQPGHDINYIALAGALGRIGGNEPVVPLNLIGYGGSALVAVIGLLAGVMAARAGAPGRVVDVSSAETALYLMTKQFAWFQGGQIGSRGTNLVDGGAWFYTVYRCADGRFVSVGAVEPQFRRALLDLLGLAFDGMPDGDDRANWEQWRSSLAARFSARTRDEWVEASAGLDACISPVLDLDEVPDHPHIRMRQAMYPGPHGWLPAPVPRFSDKAISPAGNTDVDVEAILSDWKKNTVQREHLDNDRAYA